MTFCTDAGFKLFNWLYLEFIRLSKNSESIGDTKNSSFLVYDIGDI